MACKARHLYLISFTSACDYFRQWNQNARNNPGSGLRSSCGWTSIDRVLEKAELLQQGPNNFVDLCVEEDS